MRAGLPDLLRALPEAPAGLVRRVLQAADARRIPVYLVGGPVRDWLLERRLRDVDLVVEPRQGHGAPELAAALSADAEGLRITVHERFGTATLAGEAAEIDLATVRRESYAHEGALPRVEQGTLEDDLRRRDFTVNALALPLSAAARSRHSGVVDVCGGLGDLERRRLRVIHPRSFHDDPTRALRAARLAPRLGFSLSRDSRSVLRAALRDGVFGRVSGDRLRRELVKLFEDAARGVDPVRALRLLQQWHVLGALEPGLALDEVAVAPLRRLGRAIETPPWPPARARPWLSGFMVWLAPLPPALRRRVLGRLAVRGDPGARILAFSRSRDGWLRALAKARGRGAVDALLCDLDEESLLALYASSPPALRRRMRRWALEDRPRRAPVGGRELVELGLEGPALGRALRRIRTAWLDGALRSREEALALAREMMRRRAAGARRRP